MYLLQRLVLHRASPRAAFAGRLLAALIGAAPVLLAACGVAQQHPSPTSAVPTSTGMSTDTPAPSPTPEPPLVYLTAHGNPDLPEIALTFDDGPALQYTEDILQVLRSHHVKATFFMLGRWVQQYPDLAREVVADGHAVGDHSWSHADLTQISASQAMQELTSTRDIIQQVTGVKTTLFRPPYRAYNRQILDLASSLHLSTILWSIDPHDWEMPGVGPIISTALGNAQNGAIILMHDGGGDRSQTVTALSSVIEQLQAQGFSFVTIPEMLSHLPPNRSGGGNNP
ncbi:MAG TPA: polysaccharide deacetylase family protein [Ktedonobacterales bacterium]|jgi:polysaccharide deacetylase family sporulation protein PdaB